MVKQIFCRTLWMKIVLLELQLWTMLEFNYSKFIPTYSNIKLLDSMKNCIQFLIKNESVITRTYPFLNFLCSINYNVYKYFLWVSDCIYVHILQIKNNWLIVFESVLHSQRDKHLTEKNKAKINKIRRDNGRKSADSRPNAITTASPLIFETSFNPVHSQESNINYIENTVVK